MIAIIDYGMGNLASVENAFRYLDFEVCITNNIQMIEKASHIVLPGVGAAQDAMQHLKVTGLNDIIYKQVALGKPFLGICLGMQLLFNKSFENGEHDCLGLIPGTVELFLKKNTNLRIPHMGWNTVLMQNTSLFNGLNENSHMYFVHSFFANNVPKNFIIGEADYGGIFTCAVKKENVLGVQFHPEKSGSDGLRILKNFGGVK